DLFFQVFEEHGPTHLATQPARLADAHGAQDLEQLIVPCGYQVFDSLGTPARINTLKLHWTGHAFFTAAAYPALHGHQKRDVDTKRISPADNDLSYMLGHGDPTGSDQGYLISQSRFDQTSMYLPHPFFDKERMLSLLQAIFIGDKMKHLGAVTSQFHCTLS